ncbi:MAG TPA: VanW family protein [bacterium]|nr:VanW family protein [bacterium]
MNKKTRKERQDTKTKSELKPDGKDLERIAQKSEFYKKLFLAFGIIAIFFSVYHLVYANKIIPGVTVANIKIGGKTAKEAESILYSLIKTPDTIEIKDSKENLTFEISTREILHDYNIENTVREAFLIGRTKNFFLDTKNKLWGLVKKIECPLAFSVEDTILNQKLNQIKGKVDDPAEKAFYYFDEEERLQIHAEKHGKKVDIQELTQRLLEKFERADFSYLEIPIKPDIASITRVDLEKIKYQVEPLLKEKLTIKHNDKIWEIDPLEKLDFLEVKKEKNILKLTLNNQALNNLQKTLEAQINVLPRGRVNKESEDGLVLDFELLGEGEELDTTKFSTDFEKAFFNGDKEVILSTRITEKTTDVSKYGITKLIGYGESNYAGSSSSRASNLILAAERASGVLVPPGGIYSLNKSVGPINANTGFNSAWVIASGRTVLGAGGGVCQTSTTLFRAVLNSGLPVIERHAHDYRVGYYEKDQPAGFDAAIYQPSLDMKFKNDTENYVLVQAYAIPDQTKLIFKIYGTPDGREVQITEPVITGVTPPPPTEYQETDTLKKGVMQQIDFSAWGATSVFSRKVTKNDETLFEETYRSVYRPWKAIFLVGTAD